MLRICTGLLLILGLLVTASCSRRPPTQHTGHQSPPLLKIRGGPEYEFTDHKVKVFDLIPSGKPSGVFELKVVQNGSVKRYVRFGFREMTKRSAVALSVDQERAEVTFNIECSESTQESTCEDIAFPVGARDAGSDSLAESTNEVWEEEQSIWTKRFLLSDASGWSGASGTWDHILENSRKQPDLRTYALTVRLKQ